MRKHFWYMIGHIMGIMTLPTVYYLAAQYGPPGDPYESAVLATTILLAGYCFLGACYCCSEWTAEK